MNDDLVHSRFAPSTNVVVTGAVVGGAAVLALAVVGLIQHRPSAGLLIAAAAMVAFAAINWVRPLVIFHGDQSEAVHLDEALLVILLLAAGPALTVASMAAGTVAAQVFLPRGRAKALFNSGQVILSTGAAALVFGLLGRASGHLRVIDFMSVLAATAAYYLVNNACISLVLWSTGVPLGDAAFEGFGVRLLLEAGGVLMAIPAAYIASEHLALLPAAVAPLIVLRWAFSAMFAARRDRTRVEGLFQMTLAANTMVGSDHPDIEELLIDSARTLLRCTDATLLPTPGPSSMSAPMSLLGEKMWLSVSGRSPMEPFDRADRKLLETLAAVGSTALTNSQLYQNTRWQRKQMVAIASNLGEGVCAVNERGSITFINQAAASILGVPVTLGMGTGELTPPTPVPALLWSTALRAMTSGQPVNAYDLRYRRPDETSVDLACTAAPLPDDEAMGAVMVIRDTSEQKRLVELADQALHDALTGLPNRRWFLSQLDTAMAENSRSGRRTAVLFADIDRFKIINDSLSHHAGDLVLISVVERIRKALGEHDVLARFGGDEFTILLDGEGDAEEAAVVARRILGHLQPAVALPDDQEVIVNVSIGIAVAAPGGDRDDLLHDADVAMYTAKQGGRRGAFSIFDASTMGLRSAERIQLELELHRAIESDQLEVYFQPIVSATDEHLVSMEALVRWNHPERGLLGPAAFIDLAEETGLIRPLGRFVLEQACEKARQWRQRLGLAVSISVNLSAREFLHPGLLRQIEETMFSRAGLDPSQLCFEITETVAMHDLEQTCSVLAGLKALGARVAIDDFGTGHSALGYLARFPVDVVKVHGSFVEGIETDPVKSAIVSAVVNMAAAIDAVTVVEGVETRSQLEHVRELGCDLVQGFYYARPMTAPDIETILASGPHAMPLRRRELLQIDSVATSATVVADLRDISAQIA